MTLRNMLQDMKNEHDVTYEHSIRCGNYLALFAKEMGKDAKTVQLYREAGYAHDIGKLAAMKYVKSKVNIRELSPEKQEKFREGLRSHVKYARMMLKNIPNCPQEYLDAAENHHCYYNDKNQGYSAVKEKGITKYNPSGPSIPEVAQMLAMIDVYDALTDPHREYKEQFSEEKALSIMEENCQKGQFNPKLYTVFKQKILPQIQAMSNEEKMLVLIDENDNNIGMRSSYMKDKSIYNTQATGVIKVREEQKKGFDSPRFSGFIGSSSIRGSGGLRGGMRL